jgi:NAD(P)-dependent dehydrogenase (short-subunit alcohol dehydrogenase family)
VGIGRGVAVVLARLGMNIAALDIDAANNRSTAEKVRAAGASGIAIDCDVGDKRAAKIAIDAVAEKFGGIDLLVNNAGFWDNSALTQGTFESQTEAFDKAMGASALGTFYCTRAAVDHLRAGGGGNVIGMITDHVKPGHYITGLPAVGYDCGKFAMWRQTETWAQELAPHNIRVNGLCFGAVDTPMLRSATDGLLATAMQPEDIGQAVANIVAHGPTGPTGETWLVAKTPEPREVGLAEIAALAPSVRG